MGLLVPSSADLLFVAMVASLAFTPLAIRLLGDAGAGWHIRTGQQILATHAIPRVDSFSSGMAGKPWFAWEWLFDVIAGGIERYGGLNAIVVFTALIIAGTFAWAFRLMLRRGTHVLIALAIVLLAASASMIHFLARPHVLSWFFTLAWFYVLDASDVNAGNNLSSNTSSVHSSDGTKAVWLLPALMLVWVNVHGGFLVAFVLCGIYGFGAWVRWRSLKTEKNADPVLRTAAGKRTKRLALVTLLSGAATFCNPYGYRLHQHIYEYLSNRFLMDRVDEFQSPNFHLVAQKCFAALLLITLAAFAASVRKASLSQVLIVLFAAYTGLYGARNIPVSSLLLILVVGPLLTETIADLAERREVAQWLRRLCVSFQNFHSRMVRVDSELRGHLWPVAVAVLAAVIAGHGGKLESTQWMDARFDATRFPAAAVDYLQDSGLHDPVLSTDSWGGYLIFRLYPRTRVVVDDRHDFYGEPFFKSYLRMMRVEPEWDDFLHAYDVRCVLLPKGSPLVNLLRLTTAWKVVYSDNVAVLLLREEIPAAGLPQSGPAQH
jgi:hypothetical protein